MSLCKCKILVRASMIHDSPARVLSSLFPICSNEYNGPLMQIHMLAHNMTFSKTLSGLVIIYQSGVSTSALLMQAWVLTKEV